MQESLEQALHKYFGYSAFRPLQHEIISDLFAGRDVLALMPTGGGKSLCYQLPAVLRPGLTLVISPLIALMKDQVDGLLSNGIEAAYINSSMTPAEIAEVKQTVRAGGGCKILYVAPERLMMPEFLSFLKQQDISLVAIDEAHCISEWGHDFRPEYRQLGVLKQHFPSAPLIALTATATSTVQDDIARQLRMTGCQKYVASFNRPNLKYKVEAKTDAYRQVKEFLLPRTGESGIIYCSSRKAVDSLAERLKADGHRARPYHAGLTPEQRNRNQEAFLREDADIITATIAFGMGINKPNVRFVVHYDLPKNLEGYYQETGRAGRDGLPGDCLLLFSYTDKAKIEHFISEISDDHEREIAGSKLRQMVDYAEGSVCRRQTLLAYFGEESPEDCGGCDVCLEPPRPRIDATVHAQKLMSCVARVGQSFGAGHVIDVLVGSKVKKIADYGHDGLSTYGIGAEDFSKDEWQFVTRELLRLGYLRLDGDRFPVIKLTEKSRDVLTGGEQVTIVSPPVMPAKTKSRRAGGDRPGSRRLEVDADYDIELFEELRRLRKSIADYEGVPPYIVFSDVTLKDMASRRPNDLAAFAEIYGVGEAKLDRFGTRFVRALREYESTGQCL